MPIERPALKGNVLAGVPLAFRKAPYGREQMAYDPWSGLMKYGPYKAVDVKILHLKSELWEKPPEFFESVGTLISNFLDEYLKKAGAKVEIENEYFKNLSNLVSEDHNKSKQTIEDLNSIMDQHKESVLLTYLPRYKLDDYIGKIYIKIKALGLQADFISQFYTEKTLNAVKKYTRRGENQEGADTILKNISLNILAKAGGIPWALYNELEYDIIVGSCWSIRKVHELTTGPIIKTYGVVHTFSKIGVWETFKAFICKSKEDSIFQALKETLHRIAEDNLAKRERKYRRILIMTTEPLRGEYLRKELASYLMNEHGYHLDVVIISESVPVRIYDLNTKNYLPTSGLYFLSSEDSAFIVTTGKRGEISKYTGIGVPKPIRVRLIYSSSDEKHERVLIKTLKAAYALTTMNWRSFWGSLKVPTPIYYSKLVARMFLMLDEEDIKNAFYKYGEYLYEPRQKKFEDRPWFI